MRHEYTQRMGRCFSFFFFVFWLFSWFFSWVSGVHRERTYRGNAHHQPPRNRVIRNGRKKRVVRVKVRLRRHRVRPFSSARIFFNIPKRPIPKPSLASTSNLDRSAPCRWVNYPATKLFVAMNEPWVRVWQSGMGRHRNPEKKSKVGVQFHPPGMQ